MQLQVMRNNFTVGTTLSGNSGSTVRTDQLFFSRVSNTAQFCILHKDNTIPCEPNVTGAVHLTGSSSVDIGQPSSAIVTIQDDDCEYNYATGHTTPVCDAIDIQTAVALAHKI